MKKLYLIPMLYLLLIGIVFVSGAGDLIASQFTKSVDMNKVERDYLLTKVPTTMDKGQPLPKEIAPIVNIDCNENYCKWSAIQEGLIQTYDNVLDKKYCSESNYTYDDKTKTYIGDGTCLKYSSYTIAEIEEQVSTQINTRLSDYANGSMKSDLQPYVKTSEGKLTITQK